MSRHSVSYSSIRPNNAIVRETERVWQRMREWSQLEETGGGGGRREWNWQQWSVYDGQKELLHMIFWLSICLWSVLRQTNANLLKPLNTWIPCLQSDCPPLKFSTSKVEEANTMTYHFCKIIIGHICCRWNTIKSSKNDERRRGDKAHKLDVNSTIKPSLASTLLWPHSSDIILLTLILLLRLWFTSIVQTEMTCPTCFLSNQDLNIFQISPKTAS